MALSVTVTPEQPARIRWQPGPLGHEEVMESLLNASNPALSSDFTPSSISFPS